MKQTSSKEAGSALTGPSPGLVIEEDSKGLAAAVIAVLVPSLSASRRVILLLILSLFAVSHRFKWVRMD
jgi:hypothetical protein